MKLNGYHLLLPEGTLDYFDLVDVKESMNEVIIYLEEKNQLPEKYAGQETESKGFYEPVVVQDFPLRGKSVFFKRTILIIIRSVASYWVLYMALTGICWNVNTATI